LTISLAIVDRSSVSRRRTSSARACLLASSRFLDWLRRASMLESTAAVAADAAADAAGADGAAAEAVAEAGTVAAVTGPVADAAGAPAEAGDTVPPPGIAASDSTAEETAESLLPGEDGGSAMPAYCLPTLSRTVRDSESAWSSSFKIKPSSSLRVGSCGGRLLIFSRYSPARLKSWAACLVKADRWYYPRRSRTSSTTPCRITSLGPR
jgi:hypothetical protein